MHIKWLFFLISFTIFLFSLCMYGNWLNDFGLIKEKLTNSLISTSSDTSSRKPYNEFSIQSLSCVRLFVIPRTAARQDSLSITNYQSLLKLIFMESVMPSNHLILSSPSPPAFNLSQYQGLFNESVLCIRWPKYWSFSISLSSEGSGLIFYRINRFDLLAVQGTLKSLLQHHSSKASILQHSAFFIVQLSHPYMTTGKTVALTRQTFVGKVMSLLLNMLSRLVITFLPRSKCLLISWLWSPSTVILEPK